LFRAEGGYIGIAPPGTEVGDEVALMFGSPVLFVPREVEAPAQGPVTQGSDGAPRVWGGWSAMRMCRGSWMGRLPQGGDSRRVGIWLLLVLIGFLRCTPYRSRWLR